MKRFFLIILSILYLSTATQANIRFHFCMGEFAGWGFGEDNKHSCGKCGMDKERAEKNCCKDEYKFVKLNIDQKSNLHPLTDLSHPSELQLIDYKHSYFLLLLNKAAASHNKNMLRPANSQAYYLRYCNFRI